ncbi:nucleotide exchange factor GrpE [Patescibacteria group bacterium]|nr:nucleotide exchange factor GrpE [Patescibacteria group bacterium]
MDDIDITLETEDGEGSTGTPEQKIKALREALRKSKADAAENLAGWQRSKADYLNLSRRVRDEESGRSVQHMAAVVAELAPVFDSIEASGHAAILKQLEQTLERLGVYRVRPESGERFDPAHHEAVQAIATDDVSKDNTIHSVLQSGYRLEDHLIRAARVSVYHQA